MAKFLMWSTRLVLLLLALVVLAVSYLYAPVP
jgi:hypothetical protein